MQLLVFVEDVGSTDFLVDGLSAVVDIEVVPGVVGEAA